MIIDTDKYVDAVTAAKMLGITRTRVSALCKADRFAGTIHVGHTRLIPREAVLNHKPMKRGVKPKSLKRVDEKKLLKEVLEKIKEGNENNDS